MRVAAIYDVHGNLPALEAVLRDVRAADVDQIVVGGDIVPGPLPGETLALLADCDLPVRCIRGNGEVAVLAELAGEESAVPPQFREAVRWVGQELAPEQREALRGWPLVVRLRVDGLGDVLFCHATPRNENEIFTRSTPEERLLPVFAGVDAAIVVCGHTHMQFERRVGPVRVVNAGSVGMAFGAPGAHWLLLGPGVELRRTAYDLDSAAARFRAGTYPARELAARSVLRPPSEREMLETFARSELGRAG